MFNLAAAGVAVGVLTLPLMASVSEDAMRAVPGSLREASYGLGARRLTTSLRVVFPGAISGITAAFILAVSRAVGETMVVAIAAGATGGGLRSWDPLKPGQTMTAAMAALGAGSDQVKGDDLAFQSLYFVGLLLFLITLLLNVRGRPVRAAGAGGVLMAKLLTTPRGEYRGHGRRRRAIVATSTKRDVQGRGVQGRAHRLPGHLAAHPHRARARHVGRRGRGVHRADRQLPHERPLGDAAEAGLWDAIWGTLWICIIVALVAFPIGIACAVYLEEYAGKSRFARLTQINIRNLAGVPSIVYGILGLAVFVKWLGDDGSGGLTGGRSVISGGLTLAVLVLPIVVITTTEALRAVPQGIREGALAVGATRWETVRNHVLPAASPGILTGTVSRSPGPAGEAAPLILVGAVTGFLNVGDASTWERLHGPFTAIPIVIFSWARQPGADFAGLTAAASLTLLVIIFLMNGFAIWLRNRYERKW